MPDEQSPCSPTPTVTCTIEQGGQARTVRISVEQLRRVLDYWMKPQQEEDDRDDNDDY